MKNKYPWIFRISFKIRKNWFSYFYYSRGANFLEIQLWILCISIGMPWSNTYIQCHLDNYGDLNSLRHTNDTFCTKDSKFTFLIGKYKD
jgi:hypothetical protein